MVILGVVDPIALATEKNDISSWALWWIELDQNPYILFY